MTMGKDVQPLQSVKTGILAVLTVMSGLGGSCCDDDEFGYVHLIIVYAMRLIILTLDHVINGLFMLP